MKPKAKPRPVEPEKKKKVAEPKPVAAPAEAKPAAARTLAELFAAYRQALSEEQSAEAQLSAKKMAASNVLLELAQRFGYGPFEVGGATVRIGHSHGFHFLRSDRKKPVKVPS